MKYFSTRFVLLLGVSLIVGSTNGGANPDSPSSGPGAGVPSHQATSLSPETLYHILVAEFAGRRQQVPTAVEYYQKAAEETRDPEIAERAAQVALFAHDTQRALKITQLWLALDPSSLNANRILTALLIKLNRLKEAAASVKNIIVLTENKPKEQWIQTVSYLLTDSGEPTVLVEILKKEIRPFAQRPELPLSIATLLMSTKPEEAMPYAEQALALDPTWEQAILVKAKLLVDGKKTKEALSFLEGALKTQTLPKNVQQAYAHLLLEAKEFTKAEQEFSALNKIDPGNADVLFSLALIKSSQKDYKTAEKYLSQVDKLVPDSPNIQFYRGYIQEQQQSFDKAIGFYASVSEGDNYFIAQLQVAHLLAKQEKWDEAIAHLQTIRTETPQEEIQLYAAEAGMLSASQKGEAALELLDRAFQKYPDNTEILYTRALVSQQLHHLDSTEADLRKIISKEPKNAQALNALGFTLADGTARYQEARTFIARALVLDPENPAILDSMGWVYYRLGELKQALFYLEKAYALNKDGEIAAHLGEVLFASAQKEKARALLKEAAKQDPKHPLLKKVIQKLMP